MLLSLIMPGEKVMVLSRRQAEELLGLQAQNLNRRGPEMRPEFGIA
jgi:hypothetical protein